MRPLIEGEVVQVLVAAAAERSAERIGVVGREAANVPDERLVRDEAELDEHAAVLAARPELAVAEEAIETRSDLGEPPPQHHVVLSIAGLLRGLGCGAGGKGWSE
eukprot:3496689-Prymnesium_polylepis.1